MDRNERGRWRDVVMAARRQQGWSQSGLADSAGVSLKTISNFEAGDMVPQEGTLRRLREALDLPADLRVAERSLGIAVDDYSAEDRAAMLGDFTLAELLVEVAARIGLPAVVPAA